MTKANSVRVLLVASGETAWDASGRVVGSADLPLSDEGRARIRSVAERVAAESSLSVVLSGEDEGSVESAKILAEATGARTRTADALGEVCLGLWEGLRVEQLEEKCPTAYRQWLEDPASVSPPEGETVEDAQQRIVGALCRALEKGRGAGGVAVVLRPIALGLVRCWLEGRGRSELWACVEGAPEHEWRTIDREGQRWPTERASV